MPRLPLLAGTRIVVAQAGESDVVLRPPPPLDPIADVGAAVREALRYPLSGPPLRDVVEGRGARVLVVVEPPLLPLPGSPLDPRQEALAAVLSELRRLGVAHARQTILVAGGLERRAGQRDLDWLLRPPDARAFHGAIVVHDAEDPALHHLGEERGTPVRVSPRLLEADVVVVVSAAESVLHGGPAALLGASGADTLRSVTADSLLDLSGAAGWRLALALERLLGARVPLVGVSLVLDHPRPVGRLRGWPHEPAVVERLARSPGRRLLGAVPRELRARLLDELPRELKVAAALAGSPSVAHAEALLRGISLRGIVLDRPLDAIVVPLPWKAPHRPREQLNPVTAAATGLGLALRLWREAFPVVEGGTAILLHRLGRTFGHGSGTPFRNLFNALDESFEPEALLAAEEAAAHDQRGIAAYRAGREPHPLLPYADWGGCIPARARLGAVLVAGCRDAGAARRLGFVPTHGIAAALEMAHGRAGGRARVGFLLAPPYPPLIVGE